MALKYIGIFGQPPKLLEGFKNEGFNLAVICPEGFNKAAWRAECRRLNLQYLDTPSSDPKIDIADPLFLGWCLPDEPRTLRGAKVGMEVTVYRQLCFDLRAVSPKHWLFGNFAGMDITAAFPWYKGDKDIPYFGSDADLDSLTDIAVDWYPKNRDGIGYPNSLVTRQQSLIQSWTKGTRRYWNVLEGSDQVLAAAPKRQVGGPTRDDMLEQAELSVDIGCFGIIYFLTAPQGPFGWDLTKSPNNFDPRNIDQRNTTKQIIQKYLPVIVPPPPPPPLEPEWKSALAVVDARLANVERIIKLIKES
jgi:hypothetical protein